MTIPPVLIVALLTVAGAAHAQNDVVVFTPKAGFTGFSEGNGELRLLFSHKPFHVESHGFDRPDGDFQLDQTVHFAGDTPETRTWIIHPASGVHYTGTLSGASGGVTGEVSGAQLQLRYRVKGPIFMQQTLTLTPDRKSIDNVGRVTLLGIPIGSLHELIRRED